MKWCHIPSLNIKLPLSIPHIFINSKDAIYWNGCCVQKNSKFQSVPMFLCAQRPRKAVHSFFFLKRNTTAFMSQTQSEPRDYITHSHCTRKQAPRTELIRGKQKCPYSPDYHANVSILCFGLNRGRSGGRKAPALRVLSDRAPLFFWTAVPVIRPNPRLSAPAALSCRMASL